MKAITLGGHVLPLMADGVSYNVDGFRTCDDVLKALAAHYVQTDGEPLEIEGKQYHVSVVTKTSVAGMPRWITLGLDESI